MKRKYEILESLDAFTRAYIECALWSSLDNADESGGEALNVNFDESDLTVAALRQMIADCRDFRRAQRALLEGLGEVQCGHDFWLTRNGHGSGFWDRGLGELGGALTKAAHEFGSADLYVSRGKIHHG